MSPETRLGRIVSDLLDDRDDVLVLFSALWTFGHILGLSRDSGSRILATILDAIGSSRTLVLPTYTFSFAKTRLYDVLRSKPETGVLPEIGIKTNGFVRSLHPMVSHLAFGPRAQEIISCRQSTAWGNDSVMGWFETHRARIGVLGITWGQGCAFIHRAEERFGVPYRYYKRFQGRLMFDGVDQGDCSETLFARPMGVPFVRGYDAINAHIPQLNSFRHGNDAEIPAESASADEITELSIRLLADDPYYFVENANDVGAWVRNGKDDEIRALPSESRPIV
jgi:aminoglycoside N3'-acetyltransferase